MEQKEIYDTAKTLAKDAKGVVTVVADTASSAEGLRAAVDALKPQIEQAGTGVATLGLAAKAVADAVAKAVGISAQVTTALEQVGELHASIASQADALGGKVDELAGATAGGVEQARAVAASSVVVRDALKPASLSPGWGPGRLSGLPWPSGARCSNVAQINAFVAAGRPGKPLDVIQCFNGPEQAETWNEVAGGVDDDPTKLSGTLSLTEGQKGAHFIWREFPQLDGVLSLRPIPTTDSNRNGKNPRVWERIAGGEFNWVYRRQGRKFAGLDGLYPRTGRTVLEIAREMTGDWDQHAMTNAVQWFPKAWQQIVTSMRAGYREIAGKDMPHLIWLRPARSPVTNNGDKVWTQGWLPDAEFWHGMGMSQHDNSWAPCVPEDPFRNWNRLNNAEGLLNILEVAEDNDKWLGFWEWSSHHADEDFDSGPYPALFMESMWKWFNHPPVLARLAGETYFLAGATTLTAGWEATKVYRKRWGGLAA